MLKVGMELIGLMLNFLPTPTERAAGAGSQTAGLVSFGTGTAASFEWYGDGKVTDVIQSS
jgi:hypothetical protein